MQTTKDRMRVSIKSWWGYILTGILLMAVGAAIFLWPEKSFPALSFLFSLVIMIAGFLKIYSSLVDRNHSKKVDWSLNAGIFEVIIGIFILFLTYVSKIALPFVLAFWVMLRAVYLLNTAADLKKMKVPAWGWIRAGGIVDFLLAFLVLYNPAKGVISVRIIFSAVFIIGGVFNIILALKFKNMNGNR